MKRQDEIRQQLAGEYVLGTLAGAARRRLRRLIASDAELAAEVTAWERRLGSLGVEPVPVPPAVWQSIERQLGHGRFAAPVPLGAPQAAPRRRMLSNAVWRTWAIAASVLAVVLAAGLAQQHLYYAGRMEAQAQTQNEALAQAQADERTLAMEVDRLASPEPSQEPAVYMAQLQAREEKTSWGVTVEPQVGVMRFNVSGRFPLDRGHVLALWLVGPSGVPIPLGLLPNEPGTVELHMPPGTTIPDQFTLAVTREPLGGPLTGRPTPPILIAAPSWRLTG